MKPDLEPNDPGYQGEDRRPRHRDQDAAFRSAMVRALTGGGTERLPIVSELEPVTTVPRRIHAASYVLTASSLNDL